MATSKIRIGSIPSRDLGVVTDLNITDRVIGGISHFTFTSGAKNAPWTSSGGHGILFVNADSANFGIEVAVSDAGIKARNLRSGTFGSWTSITSL